MTQLQTAAVNRILAGIASRGIDVSNVHPVPVGKHGNVSLQVQGWPEIVVGFKGGVETIGYRTHKYSSNVEAAIHSDLMAATRQPKPYVKPTPKKQAVQTVQTVTTAAPAEDAELAELVEQGLAEAIC